MVRRSFVPSPHTDSLEPNGTLVRSGTAEDDFEELKQWFKDDEAGYVIYFLDSPHGNYIFISLVPDATTVQP
jgi:hypothetical protein